MADTDDVQNYSRKLQNQLEKLQNAGIPEEDREAIESFFNYLDVRTGNGEGVIISNINRLRLAAERGDVVLTEAEESDITSLMSTLKQEHDLAESTLRNYRKALRKFFDWRGEDWAEDIHIGSPDQDGVDPERLLSDEEIDELLDAAENPRDKAAIALLADTGLRIGAIASLRVRDIDLSGQLATIAINEDANVKGAEGTVPVTWSKGYLANWLDVHPRRDEPDAAFIHKFGNHHSGKDDGALTYQYLSRRIKDIGERAGIDRARLNPHNFRKSAISRWIREGLPEQAIKHRATWVDDSSQFETYSGVTDEEMNAEIAAHYGLEPEQGETRPDLEECPQCRTPLRSTARFCPGCAAPLTASAADEVENVEDATFESMANADEQADQAFISEFRRRFKEDPDFRATVAGEEYRHEEPPSSSS